MTDEALPQVHPASALPSPFDYRDHIARVAAIAAAKGQPPIQIDFSQIPVLMQGARPACVSHAAAYLLMYYWYRKTGKIIHFSARFIDAWMKTFDGLPLAGSGAYPRYSMRALAKVGCATEDVLPNDVSLSDEEYRNPAILTPAVMANAAQYKAPGYVQVNTDVDSAREAMALFGPLSMLWNIGTEFYTAPSGASSWSPSDIDPLRTPKTIIGGHELTRIQSNDPDIDRLRNEWSAGWDLQGDATFHPSAWTPFIGEQWAIAELPDDVSKLLSELPSPDSFHYNWTADLSFGMPQNDDVKYAQIALMILGFLDPSTVPPAELGYYGNKTAAAVLKYQQARRISPPYPHAIGPQTRKALNADFAI